MFYPKSYDAVLILNQYDEWCEISKKISLISVAKDDSIITLKTLPAKRKHESSNRNRYENDRRKHTNHDSHNRMYTKRIKRIE